MGEFHPWSMAKEFVLWENEIVLNSHMNKNEFYIERLGYKGNTVSLSFLAGVRIW